MGMIIRAVALTALLLAPAIGVAETGHSKYAGQQAREIKSLSAADLAELRRGGGWGLAKAAELNGVPGPAHLLELKDRIPLSADQTRQIETLRVAMKAEAIALGARLEKHFADRSVNDEILRGFLNRIAETRCDLRYAHLATHLETPKILSHAQIARYNELRGYDRPSQGVGYGGHSGH